MLLNDFFKIIEIQKDASSPGKAVVKIELNEDHSIFSGHFPGNPIVPGVCQIQMVKELLSHLEGRKFQLKKGTNIKHLGMIIPTMFKTLDFNLDYHDGENNTVMVNCSITSEDRIFLKFKGVFV